MAESRLMHSMLLDFYGELLTEKQRECFDLHYNEDLSLAEIAEQSGISRQGVWDNIKRAEAALIGIEEKTGLIRRFSENRKELEKVSERMSQLIEVSTGKARELAEGIKQDIDSMKTRG